MAIPFSGSQPATAFHLDTASARLRHIPRGAVGNLPSAVGSTKLSAQRVDTGIGCGLNANALHIVARSNPCFMSVYVYETIPASQFEPPRQFELCESMADPALTHDPESGRSVRRIIQGGYLNTQRWTKGTVVPQPTAAKPGAHCCGISGCGPH